MTNEKMLTLLNNFLADGNYLSLHELQAGLCENIRDTVNKSSGRGSLAKSMNAIIKKAKKDGLRPALMGAWIHEGFTTVCDGYRVIQTMEPVAVEWLDKKEEPLKVHNLFEPYYKYEVQLPTAAELKTFIKIRKAEGEKHPVFALNGENGDRIGVDPEFLLTMIEAIPVTTARYSGTISPIYLENANGTTRGIVLPIRMSK